MAVALRHPYIIKPDGSADAVGVQENFEDLALAIAGAPRIIGGGQFNLATGQSTNSTAYVKLGTPDLVTCPVATNGIVIVGYQATWQATVGGNGRAAIFIGANQLKGAQTNTAAPVVQETSSGATANFDGALGTSNGGLIAANNTTAYTGDVTTGQIIGVTVANANNGGWTPIWNLASGTYDFSVQFKNAAAGTLTVKNRHLWVVSLAFS